LGFLVVLPGDIGEIFEIFLAKGKGETRYAPFPLHYYLL
jgi:hypothetical protein